MNCPSLSSVFVLLYYSTYILFCKYPSHRLSPLFPRYFSIFLHFFTISTHCLLHFPCVGAILCAQRKKRFRAGCNSRPAVQSASRTICACRIGATPIPTVTVWMKETIYRTVPVSYPFARKLVFRVFFCTCNKRRGKRPYADQHTEQNSQNGSHRHAVRRSGRTDVSGIQRTHHARLHQAGHFRAAGPPGLFFPGSCLWGGCLLGQKSD